MAFYSTFLSSLAGVALGLSLERGRFPGKRLVVRLNRTLMGVPPVVIGLVTYLLLMRRGPLGFLGMLFTLPGMVMAQFLIITPIICGTVYTSAVKRAPAIRAFAVSMGANKAQTGALLLREMSGEIYFAIVSGFGRSISEVGAVMIVGGNIERQTRTMTTAITLLRNKGNYTDAIILGVVLLILAFLVQSAADLIRRREGGDENI
jgi:tungstate transport system permease protein